MQVSNIVDDDSYEIYDDRGTEMYVYRANRANSSILLVSRRRDLAKITIPETGHLFYHGRTRVLLIVRPLGVSSGMINGRVVTALHSVWFIEQEDEPLRRHPDVSPSVRINSPVVEVPWTKTAPRVLDIRFLLEKHEREDFVNYPPRLTNDGLVDEFLE